MNMSFPKFLGLLAILAIVYVAYTYWWGDQDQDGWIRGWNNWAISSEQELDEDSGKEPDTGVPSESDAWVN